jgi:hypothetical protein
MRRAIVAAALALAFAGPPAIAGAALLVPTPSPSLSPLPARQVNYYAMAGAHASGLDPQLVRAIIDAESAGDPRAVSRAGAVGMMQLMAETAGDCGIHDRYDALANVICGSRSLAGLVHKYGLSTGVAAYNFGSGNVEAVGGDLRKMPAETQTYVAAVIARYNALQHAGALIVETPPSPSASPSPEPSADPNPCAHRLLCGPIHLLPRDSAGWQRAAAQVIAALVSASAFRSAQSTDAVTYPQLGFVGSSATITGTHVQSGSLLGHTSARPFFAALATYAVTDTLQHGVQSVFRMPIQEQRLWERVGAAGAIGDALAYRDVFATANALRNQSVACQSLIDSSQTTNSRIVWVGTASKGVPVVWSPQSSGLLTTGGGPCEQFGTGAEDSRPAPFNRDLLAAAVTLRPSRSYSQFALATEAAFGLSSAGTHAIENIGPIHLLPSDPRERSAFLTSVAATIVDGLVTSHGTRGNPALEANPFLRPFVRGRMPTLMLGWTLSEIATHALTRKWSAEERAQLDFWSAGQHAAGVSSWWRLPLKLTPLPAPKPRL